MKTLLIADEDQRTKNIVRYTFEWKGYKVVSARSGADVMLKVKEIKPDIVLVDVSLSDKSGFDISGEIKKDPFLKDTAVILLASPFIAFDESKRAQAYADALILKPFRFEEIISKVESLSAKNDDRFKDSTTTMKKSSINYGNVLAVMVAFILLLTPAPLLDKEILSELSLADATSKLNQLQARLRDEIRKIDLIQAQLKPVTSAAEETKIVVTVDERGEVSINDEKYPLSELRFQINRLINSLGGKADKEELILRANASISFGTVMEIAEEIKKAGAKKVEFSVERPLFSEPPESQGIESAPGEEVKTSQTKAMKVSEELTEVRLDKEEHASKVEKDKPIIQNTKVSETLRKKDRLLTVTRSPTTRSKTTPRPENEMVSSSLERSNGAEELKIIEERKGQAREIEREEKPSQVVLLRAKSEGKKETTMEDVYRLIQEIKRKID